MFKKLVSNQKGLTFIELMVAITVIVVISAVSVVYINGNIRDDVEFSTDQLMADLRYARNLASSKTVYDFSGHPDPTVAALGEVYPPGGYGVEVVKAQRQYRIFADSGIDSPSDSGDSSDGYEADVDVELKLVTIENSLLEIRDPRTEFVARSYFTFISENEAVTNLWPNEYDKYQIMINYPATESNDGYVGTITLGEKSSDGSIWTALGRGFRSYEPPPPPAPPRDPVDRVQMADPE